MEDNETELMAGDLFRGFGDSGKTLREQHYKGQYEGHYV